MTDGVVAADAAGLRRAAELLRQESVCVFPTETVYGLGAHAFSAKAVAEVYRLKRRPSWNPLIVHVASAADAEALAHEWPEAARRLAARFWPGPLSLVVERAHHLPANGGPSTVAVRVPAHPVALALLEECGLPLAAPSANRSESISPTTAEHVIRSLPDVPLVLDGGPCRLGIESTVVDVTVSPPRLLRPGALSLRAIRDVVGALALPGDPGPGADPTSGVRSPGLAHRHYAPRARLHLVDDPAVLAERAEDADPGTLGVLTHLPAAPPGAHVELLSADPLEYAADLYAALHRLDDAGVTTILAQAPPEGDDWLAVRDRLTRASAR
ncbi:threonylcarbamoyl-AMP synthase [Dactylosporangium aurantiacum]|uniref:Threonylcarbamoyl-AMP synthase n=1 Tax=Dactylosporangium aurantiacum TaxID=35754 RepID=A0A9Q9MH56_9ACTN|nr:L-threonylcarbamoyladenylate synthase [Dactylosporangium aurantiacum]MDG6107381.1 L-threonylcarbamoyladenylate synthase [Dactylosporangium aurantiacum]UWZ54490.1 threonylcarbamoyl-AMP synthase [Dactylosporangium aurantiacum]